MKTKRRNYSEKFKAEVVGLVREGQMSEREVARERELAESTVRRWIRNAASSASEVGAEAPQTAPQEAPVVESAERTEVPSPMTAAVSCAHRSYLAALRRLLDAVEAEVVDEAGTFGQIEGAVDAVMAVTGARDASVLARDEETGDMFFVACRGVLPPGELLWKRVPPGQGIVQWVAGNRRAVTINDVTHDPRFYAEIDSETGFRTRNLMATPLERDDRVLGVIEVLNKDDGALFTVEDLGHLRLMAYHLAGLLARLA